MSWEVFMPTIGGAASAFGAVAVALVISGVIVIVYAYLKGMWIFKRYNIPMIVFEQRGMGFRTRLDKARLEGKNGKEYYEVASDKSIIPAMLFKDIAMGDELIVFKTGRGEYMPAHPEFRTYTKQNEKGETITFTDMVFFPMIRPEAKNAFIEQFLAAERRFQLSSFLTRYGPYIMLFVTVIVCAVMIYVTLDRLAPIASSLNAGMDRVAHASEVLANHTCYIPPIPGG